MNYKCLRDKMKVAAHLFKLLIFLFLIFPGKVKTEDIEGNNELLELLNTEVSTASKYTQTISEAPASVTIISSEDIRKYGYKNMVELLNSVKSFFLRNDRQYFYTGTRGFERPSSYGSKILMLINGHTCNDNLYQSTFYENELGLDLSMIDRVEIVQGPGSVMYGTGAILSVINIITKTGNQKAATKFNYELGNPGKSTYRVSSGYEIDNNFNFTLSGVYGSSDGDNLYFKEYDDPTTNNGMANNLDREKHYGLMGTLNLGDFSLQGYFNTRDKYIPTAAWDMMFNQPNTWSTDERMFAELKYQKDLSMDKKIMIRTYYDYYLYNASYPYDDEGLYYSYDYHRGKWAGIESVFHWDIGDYNRLSAGFEYKNNFEGLMRVGDEGEPLNLDINNPYNVVSIYVQDSYQMTEELCFTAGIRYDDYSNSENSVAPRLAVVYNPSNSTTLKLLYGEAYRIPSLYELYYNYEGYELANPKLKPEKNRTYEFVWEEKLAKNFFGTLNLYYYTIYDLIDKVQLNEVETQFQNFAKANSMGAEVGTQAKISKDLSSFLNICYQFTKNENTGKILNNTPRFLIKSGLSYELFENLFCSTELFFETKRKTIVDSIDTYSKSFLLANLNFHYRFDYSISFVKNIELDLKISNIFDDKHPLPGSYEHRQTLIDQYGRRFLFNLSINI